MVSVCVCVRWRACQRKISNQSTQAHFGKIDKLVCCIIQSPDVIHVMYARVVETTRVRVCREVGGDLQSGSLHLVLGLHFLEVCVLYVRVCV